MISDVVHDYNFSPVDTNNSAYIMNYKSKGANMKKEVNNQEIKKILDAHGDVVVKKLKPEFNKLATKQDLKTIATNLSTKFNKIDKKVATKTDIKNISHGLNKRMENMEDDISNIKDSLSLIMSHFNIQKAV